MQLPPFSDDVICGRCKQRAGDHAQVPAGLFQFNLVYICPTSLFNFEEPKVTTT